MSKNWRIFLMVAIATFGAYAVVAFTARARAPVVPNGDVLTSEGKNTVFAIIRGAGNKIIREFDAKQGDKIRLAGFGITNAGALPAMMKQIGPDVEIELSGGQQLWIFKVALTELTADVFQLELDRTGLVKTFAEEFDTFSWDSEAATGDSGQHGTWRTNFGYGAPGALDSRTLPPNGELEVYADPAFRGTSDKPLGINPFRVVNGVLEISAAPVPEDVRRLIWNRKYTSGLITTRQSFTQQYGVFEMRARLPKGRGLWPAFWLLPPNGVWPPEIDVMEVLGNDTTMLYTSWHSRETGPHTTETISTRVPDLSADFHTYAFEWNKYEIRWFFDGVEVARRSTPGDMQRPMYVLANLAVGGGWPKDPDASTPFPAVFAIDWIRVYRRE
jgi:beta-glucanase (GH16 family)